MSRLRELLNTMCKIGASDLFIKPGTAPCVRVDGRIAQLKSDECTPAETANIAAEVMDKEQTERFAKMSEMDLGTSIEGLGRFRVNAYRHLGQTGMVFRHVPAPEFDFEDLNLPPAVRALSERRRGLVLVTGTTGSGKSTTLAAMINHINQKRHCHIITIEDPIEFVHKDIRSIVSQREVGIDTKSFSSGLRHVVRQSPDVILIGEMRDLETIQTSIASAETGHLVFSTLHTTDATLTVERIINYFPNHLQQQIRMELALTLQGVICQRLLPLAQGRGRIPATEIMVVTAIIKKMLLEGKTMELRDYIRDGAHSGMMTFDQSLLRLYNDKLISMDEALANATSPDEFRQAAGGLVTGVKGRDFTTFH